MRYFKPGSNEGKSLYIPLPLEFMAKKAEQEQASIDAVKNTAGELYGQIDFNAIPEQERFKTAKINEYITAIDNLATEVNQNPENWSTIGTKVNALAQKFNTDEDILSMENTYTGAATRLKDVRANGAEHNIWVDDYPLFLQQQKASDKLLSYDYKGSKKVLDWLTPTKTLMDDVTSTKITNGKIYFDPGKDEYITKKTTGGEYTTSAMVAQRALDITPVLREQLAFNDFFAKQAYEKLGLIDGADIYYTLLAEANNKDENKESATKIRTALGLKEDQVLTKDDMMNFDVYSYAYNIGTGKIKSSTTYDEDINFVDDWYAKKYGLDTKKSPSTPGTKFDYTADGLEGLAKTSDFDNYSDSSFESKVSPEGVVYQVESAAQIKQFYEKWNKKTKDRYEVFARSNNLGELFDKIVTNKGGTEEEKKLFKEKMKLLVPKLNEIISESPDVDRYDTDRQKEENLSYFKNANPTVKDGVGYAINLSVYDPENDELFNTTSLAIEKLGFSDEATISVTGEVNNINHGMGAATAIDGQINTKFADPVQVTIHDKGKDYVLYMQRPKYKTADAIGVAKRQAIDESYLINYVYNGLEEGEIKNVGETVKNDNLKKVYITKKDGKPVITENKIVSTGDDIFKAYEGLIDGRIIEAKKAK